ncbi:MAG TPA: nuclear transport factor 2 family protein [Candidatus Binataceae bacterium]|nr:nuclear transport factor 2 family protein [Candidatus Binataceae bacterium]
MDEAKLALLIDRAEISDVQLRYATALDTRDWALFRTCFTDEIDVDFTSVFGGEPRRVSADRWAEAAKRTLTGLKATQHMITNHVITVDGDSALCVAYVQAQHYLPNDKGESTQTMGGYYTNRFERTPQGWRIRSCKLTLTWNTGNWHIFTLAREKGRGERQ